LLGRQGNEEITAQEWADRLAMIPWEVVTGIGPRVPRRYRGEVGEFRDPRGARPELLSAPRG
jgi:hypothetical protein